MDLVPSDEAARDHIFARVFATPDGRALLADMATRGRQVIRISEIEARLARFTAELPVRAYDSYYRPRGEIPMDARSEANLAHVHPDLARVMRAAAQSPQPFIVDYGLRTLQAEAAAVASGHSETMHSRHLPDAHYGNVAMAVDVAALVGGQVSFAPGHEQAVFGEIAAQVLEAAKTLGVRIQWGGEPVGAWIDGVTSHFRDWGHFQLDPSAYP